ncbi:hypothetical protein KJ695_03165 [Patescibacteria group bacterium]|nr:hypothetical protein [Patescibacteria group bacterium]MBU4056881.1 hypothetical protein [Patescibacteria group bacterium]MBU4368603.1 hypothetical protein [Patescibacteria group bacterium]
MISLNLLPPERKKTLYWISLTKNVIFWGSFVFMVLIFLSLPFWVSRLYLNNTLNDLDQKIDFYKYNTSLQQMSFLEKSSKNINDLLINIDKIGAEQIYWSKVLTEITGAVPSDAQIFSLELNSKYALGEVLSPNEGIFTIIGRAKTRDAILALQAILESSADFKDIQAPLDNLVKKTDADFKFRGTILFKNFKQKNFLEND